MALSIVVAPRAAAQAGTRTHSHLPIPRLSSYLLGLLLGEMVTSLRMTLGDCCRGGVRQGLSSTSGREVSSSPTSTRSRLPSSIPFPSHRPHGNLEVKQRPLRAAHFSSILPCCSGVPSTKPIHRDMLQNQIKGSPGSLCPTVYYHWNYLSGLGDLGPVSSNVIRVYLVGNHPVSFKCTRQSQTLRGSLKSSYSITTDSPEGAYSESLTCRYVL